MSELSHYCGFGYCVSLCFSKINFVMYPFVFVLVAIVYARTHTYIHTRGDLFEVCYCDCWIDLRYCQ